MCWQHAKTWRHKWRSLTRNQSILFILTVFGVLLAAAGLILPAVGYRGAEHVVRQRDVEVGPSETHSTTDNATAVVKHPEQQSDIKTDNSATLKPKSTPTTGRVDWHDKHNWRVYLRVGMTKKEVRQLFGEAETIDVSSDLETWDYGSGEVTFVVNADSPDGAIFSWFEPH